MQLSSTFICRAAAVFAAVLATSTFFPAPALATFDQCHQLNPNGTEDDYGTIAATEGPDISNGVRATVKIVQNSAVHCQYVSSVAVATANGGLFEFGYIVGYWGPATCDGVSHSTYYSKPTLFSYRITNLRTRSCHFFADRHPAMGSSQVFRAEDTNRDKRWGSFYNDVDLQPSRVQMDFTAGVLITNMERGAPLDTGAADFRNVFEYHSSNGWTTTENLHRYCDLDNQWLWVVISGHDGKTAATSASATACSSPF